MNSWLVLIGYEAVWFATVIGAGHDRWWPGVLATLVFATWRLVVSPQRVVEARLIIVALALGLAFDAVLVWANLASYAAAWPWSAAPAWLTALWIAFALTIVPLFGYLHARPLLALLFGAIGGPLAYLAAAHGWHAVSLAAPAWQAIVALAMGWGIALPLLCSLARRWLRPEMSTAALTTGGAP